MPKRRWQDKDKIKVINLYIDDGLNIREIHEKINMPMGTVSWILKHEKNRLGITIPKKFKKKKKKYSNTFKLNAIKMVIEDGKELDVVVKELDMLQQTLYNWVNNYQKDKVFVSKLHKSVERELAAVEKSKQEIKIKEPENINSENKKYKIHTNEMKLMVLNRVINKNEPIENVARHMKINPSTIRTWLTKHKSDPNFYNSIEDVIAKKDHDYYNDIGTIWYLDKEELVELKKLLDEGKDDWTCSYIVGVAYADYDKMKEAALALN